MPSPPQKLSPAEFAILKHLWLLESATVAEVRDQFARQTAPAYTTVMTLLGRLADKGAVRIAKDARPYRYRPALQRATMLRRMLDDFVKTVYEGDAQLLVQHLLDDAHLTADEVREALAESSEEL